MSEQKTLLFIGAHPDDETFGLGGTLAKYAGRGVKVYYLCGTRGEMGTDSPDVDNDAFGDVRWAEMERAAEILGLAGLIHLGYRDSGMAGAPSNEHPRALAAAPIEEVAGRMVKALRELRPQVVVTFDPIGGYHHPDHIAIHKATVNAFHASGDAARYPEAGPPFQPQKLYFQVFSRRILKVMVRLMPLFGIDPRHFGRNKDVDITALVDNSFPIHAEVSLSKEAMERRDRAFACYVSQHEGGPPRRGVVGIMFKMFGLSGGREFFMRYYPPPGSRRERDLFEGI